MSVENHNNDKRENRRVEAKLDISTFVKNKKLQTYMRNLSCNGIMIVDKPECQFEKDKEFKLAIPINKEKELEVNAKVVWVKGGMIGLTFSNIDDTTVSSLNQLILRFSNVSDS